MTALRRRALLAAPALLAPAARAQAPRALRVVAFAGASNLVIWAAEAAGIFSRHGLAVALDLTPNSRAMASDLQAGRYDLALTSADNVVAYRGGQGEAGAGVAADLVALFGVDDGMLSVMGAPGVGSLDALRGRAVSVDAMTTGFAFVLREVLARAGLADAVEWVGVGGGAQRLAALREGRQAATLLNTPLDLAAEEGGCARLLRARDVIGPYQGIVAAAQEGMARDRLPDLVAFARAFRESVARLAANLPEAAALLAARGGLSPAGAARAAAALLDPGAGLFRDLRLDEAGLATVLRLRAAHGPSRAPLREPAAYLDRRVLAALD